MLAAEKRHLELSPGHQNKPLRAAGFKTWKLCIQCRKPLVWLALSKDSNLRRECGMNSPRMHHRYFRIRRQHLRIPVNLEQASEYRVWLCGRLKASFPTDGPYHHPLSDHRRFLSRSHPLRGCIRWLQCRIPEVRLVSNLAGQDGERIVEHFGLYQIKSEHHDPKSTSW